MSILTYFFDWLGDIQDAPKVRVWSAQLNNQGNYRLLGVSVITNEHKTQVRLRSVSREVIVDIEEPLTDPIGMTPSLNLSERTVLDVGGIIDILIPHSLVMFTISLTEPYSHTDFDVVVRLPDYPLIKVTPLLVNNINHIEHELL